MTIVLPYMGIISTELKVKLHKTFKQLIPVCDLKVIFKISLRMKNYFNFKDKTKQELRSLLIYNLIVTAAMLNKLVKPNGIIEHEPRNMLVLLHSQESISVTDIKLELYMIVCF